MRLHAQQRDAHACRCCYEPALMYPRAYAKECLSVPLFVLYTQRRQSRCADARFYHAMLLMPFDALMRLRLSPRSAVYDAYLPICFNVRYYSAAMAQTMRAARDAQTR
jgi:hypothetical protein